MKKITTQTFVALLMLLVTNAIGQTLISTPINSNVFSAPEECGTAVIHERLMNTDAEYKKSYSENEALIRKIISEGRSNRSGTYTIPVVVHVMHLGEAVGTGTNISDAQINSAIANLNTCYSGTNPYSNDITLRFQLAVRKFDCSATTGIVRVNASGTSDYATNGITTSGSNNELTIKALSKWPNGEYYNIWVVSEIDGNNGGAGTQGYAYYPGASADRDGAVVLHNSFGYDPSATLGYNLKSYTKWNTTTLHELGHAFNLKHTFEGDSGGGVCPTNTSCSTQGDECCDTEAHRRGDGDCGATGTTCTGQNISNIVNNIMAYSSDVCQTVFTNDQKARMVATITGPRASLASSPGLIPVSGSAPAVAKTCSPQTTTLGGGLGMGVCGLTIGATTYSSSNADAENGYRNNWCSSFSLNTNTLYSITVKNGTINNEKVKVYIDYNNDGDFLDAGENVFTSNVSGKSHSGTFTTASNPANGQPIWMRVISDFSGNTINGPCYTPQYGQVEDFSVIFPLSGATELLPTQCGQTFADLSGFFNCYNVPGAQDYEWEFTNVGLGFNKTIRRGSAVPDMFKAYVTGLKFGNTYNVRIRTKMAGVWGSFGNTCTITIAATIPTTQMVSAECGQSFADLSGYFNCNPVSGAEDYEWEFTNVGLGYNNVVRRGAGVTNLYKAYVSGLIFGNTYNVRVRAKIAGSWASFGNTCAITLTGSAPTTQMVPAECGQTFADLSGYFNCNPVVAAEDYEWEFTNVGLAFTKIVRRGAPITDFYKQWASGLLFGFTYNVRVKAKVSGTWGAYGNSCAITLAASIPTTELVVSQCGQSVNLVGFYNCNQVQGAQDYEWEFVNVGLGYNKTIRRGAPAPNFYKPWAFGMVNGATYDVKVRAKVAGTWGAFGNMCQITINTSLLAPDLSNNKTFDADEALFGNVSVYPNPSNNSGFNVTYEVLEGADLNSTLEVYDYMGRKVIEKQVTSIVGINEITLNRDGNLPKGNYLLIIKVNNSINKQKVIVN